jgi:hypothetical protein
MDDFFIADCARHQLAWTQQGTDQRSGRHMLGRGTVVVLQPSPCVAHVSPSCLYVSWLLSLCRDGCRRVTRGMPRPRFALNTDGLGGWWLVVG